jgi:hypothetical protein
MTTLNEEAERRLLVRLVKATERIAAALEAMTPPKIEIIIPEVKK